MATPETRLTVRPGDLILAELAVTNATGTVFPEDGAARGHYVVSTNPALEPPEGWSGVRPVPSGVVDALVGLEEGEHIERAGILAFGDHDPALVEVHDRVAHVPRLVANDAAYDHAWASEPAGDGHVRLLPSEDDRGASLATPRWCGAGFCLFRSTLVDWNETTLVVEHEPVVGARVFVEGLSTWLTVAEITTDTVHVDGNDPRAGERFDLTARILDVRAPSDALRRAPSFDLRALDGQRIVLEQHLGHPVVLEFFASWCPSCVKNTDHLRRLQATYGDAITIFAINVDPFETPDQLDAFIEAHGVTWPILLDPQGTTSRDYRVGQLSTEVLISPEGNIAHVETGVADHERVARILHGLIGDHHHGDGPGALPPHGPTLAGTEGGL